MSPGRVAVFGASGFVGGGVVDALSRRGFCVLPLRAPRLDPVDEAGLLSRLTSHAPLVAEVAGWLARCSAVVNAAGSPDAGSTDDASLLAVNALLPAVLAAATTRAEVPRYVHVSSAAVQGRKNTLDESRDRRPFSAYSQSKVIGEELLEQVRPEGTVSYRPPGVHAVDRHLTRTVARVAASPVRSVAAGADRNSPQALLANVGDAIAFLATCPVTPPSVVVHPSEGLTTRSLQELLGGRRPHEIPAPLARVLTGTLTGLSRWAPPLAAHARRLEVMWWGQGQSVSWLTGQGWTPVQGHEQWRGLGVQARRGSRPTSPDEGA